uniref:Si:dkey-57c15.1 n=1 Tax=Eptatretus burgeri TaxID=7764 RepID=A0A8C4NBB4_EPTBU
MTICMNCTDFERALNFRKEFHTFASWDIAVMEKGLELRAPPSSEDKSDGGAPVPSLKAFCRSSTLHGIRHILGSGGFTGRRMLWLLAFLCSLAVFIFMCAETVQRYFDYPQVTKLDEVPSSFMPFPVVTFCNVNAFRFSRISRNDLYHAGEFLRLLDARLQVPDTHLVEPRVFGVLRERADFRNFKPRPFSMREFYGRAGHDLRDMLIKCKFRGRFCSHLDFDTVRFPPSTSGSGRKFAGLCLGLGGDGMRKLRFHDAHIMMWSMNAMSRCLC